MNLSAMELRDNDYQIWYDAATQTLTCQGALRLGGPDEYAPIAQLLEEVVKQEPENLELDLRKLAFLNSSGINTLSKFVIKVRQHSQIQLVIQGSNEIPWQTKSLPNLQRLLPTLKLQFD
ncbi:MAG: hypothetical protein OHK0035_31730 [Cyanobacteria bacterium J069]